MDSNCPADWVALTLLPQVGALYQRLALARFGVPGEIAYHVPVEELARLPRFPAAGVDAIRRARPSLRRRAEREVRRCARWGIRLISCRDDDYPAALAEIPDPPVLLYQRGTLAPGVLRIAVIGSRVPTRYGRQLATGIASGLAARGVEIVSGGARGIDSLAHRGALEGDGRTVCVLGSGLLRPYPEENADLFERIAEDGALISEFALDTPPLGPNFLRRNRLISGLSAAVVVVEATIRSGSQNTASHALDQGREVMAVPGPVTSRRSDGCHRLIQQGAKLVQNIEDILEELPPLYRVGLAGSGDSKQAYSLDNLTAEEAELIKLLDEIEPLHLDELADRTLFGIAQLQEALFALEVRGAVDQDPGGYYLLRPRTPRKED